MKTALSASALLSLSQLVKICCPRKIRYYCSLLLTNVLLKVIHFCWCFIWQMINLRNYLRNYLPGCSCQAITLFLAMNLKLASTPNGYWWGNAYICSQTWLWAASSCFYYAVLMHKDGLQHRLCWIIWPKLESDVMCLHFPHHCEEMKNLEPWAIFIDIMSWGIWILEFKCHKQPYYTSSCCYKCLSQGAAVLMRSFCKHTNKSGEATFSLHFLKN